MTVKHQINLEEFAKNLTIVTANYNHSSMIGRCIESVISLETPVAEHIVVDDASTDNSISVIEMYQSEIGNLSLIKCKQNQGAVTAFAKGIKNSTTKFITFLSADDQIDPNYLKRVFHAYKIDPELKLVCGDIELLDEKTQSVRKRRFFKSSDAAYISPTKISSLHSSCIFPVNGGCPLIDRKALLDRTSITDAQLKWHHDIVALNAIAYRYGFWYVPKTFSK